MLYNHHNIKGGKEAENVYYAHVRDDGATQSVSEHLQGTARFSAAFAAAFSEEKRGALLGMAHDIGKTSPEFQKRLHGGPKVDHATAGALECMKIGEPFAGCCVIGHHGGLPDFGSRWDTAGDASYIGRLKRGEAGAIPPYDWQERLDAGIPMPKFRDDFERSFWMRMLYSCLVDADYLDTEAFMTKTVRPQYDCLPELLGRLQAYIAPWFPAKGLLNTYRCDILNRCLTAASAPRGVFSLTVPTGGGKTVSSLAFALKHAVENGMDRVIYVIPYTSIIEQNAKVFQDILGKQNVIAHYCSAQYDEEDVAGENLNRRLACENWDAPVIVTTAVQFFESLYSNRPSRCRKLHNIANSVIVFDEAQMIPGGQLEPCVGAIATLVSNFRATAVLCTATQPAIEDILQKFSADIRVTEICQQVDEVYDQFRRVTYEKAGMLTNEALGERMKETRQVLCIVNTRKMAQDVFALLPEEGRFHLSTLMYPKHRTQMLDEIRDRLKRGLVCRVVSTSLIEAGVDVDFPAVYRQMTGLDSLVQAAGRCNREGKRRPEESIVTCFEAEQPAPPLQRINIGAAREVLAGDGEIGSAETIQRYFTAWRSLVGENLDKSHVVEHLKKGIQGCLLPFKTVAEDFHMIDQNTKTVYIPAAGAEELCQRILDGYASRSDYRKAGEYCVNVYEQHYDSLLSSGGVRAVDDDSGVLVDPGLYDAEKGLSLKAEYGKAYFA